MRWIEVGVPQFGTPSRLRRTPPTASREKIYFSLVHRSFSEGGWGSTPKGGGGVEARSLSLIQRHPSTRAPCQLPHHFQLQQHRHHLLRRAVGFADQVVNLYGVG
jgi:hypothetical protein